MPSGRQSHSPAPVGCTWTPPNSGDGYSGVRVCSVALLPYWTWGKLFAQQQNTDRRSWPRSISSQGTSRTLPALHPGTATTPYIQRGTGCFQWLQKEFSQKTCCCVNETFSVCMQHCACHQTAAGFHLGEKQPLKQLKLYGAKGRHNNKIQ